MNRREPAWLDENRDIYLLGLMRLGFGVLLFLQAAKALLGYRRTGIFFGDVFHVSLLPGSWVPSHGVFLGLLVVQALAALAAVFGVYGRKALLIAALIGLFLLCVNRLDYHNNRYALYLFSFLMAFAPCDRTFTIRRAEAFPRRGSFWAVRLVGLQVSLIYLASGLGKLFDADWRGGQVLHVRYERAIEFLAREGMHFPGAARTLLSSPSFAELTSKGAILTELFLAIGLWLPRTRALALWYGLLFHVAIELAARVESFSFIMLTAYLAFVKPELEERELVFDPRSPKARRVAGVVRALDWLRRFRRTERALEERGEAHYVVDHDGSIHRGLRAWVLLSRSLVPLFPMWGLLASVARLLPRRDGTERAT